MSSIINRYVIFSKQVLASCWTMPKQIRYYTVSVIVYTTLLMVSAPTLSCKVCEVLSEILEALNVDYLLVSIEFTSGTKDTSDDLNVIQCIRGC